MKKIMLLTALFTLSMTLSACKETEVIECETDQTLVDGVCVDDEPDPDPDPDPVGPVAGDVDAEGVYTTYISGVENMNPYSESMASSSEMFGYITDSLYAGDYDWAAAIDAGLATEIGDFATSGAAALPYGRFPSMAASEPVDISGDGTVWQITLREDLEFEDGTAIDADTFDYSWSMLLDPYLLNVRASGLYDATDLPLVGAELYFKQNSPDKDDLGYELYKIGDTVYSRENAYFGGAVGHPTWPMYHVETGAWHDITGPDGQPVYVEDWGAPSYGTNGFVLEDINATPFHVTEAGVLIAFELGWIYGDGTAVLTEADLTAEEIAALDYAGALPAYMDDAFNRAPVDETTGIPVDGVWTYEDAVAVEWDTVGFEVISQYVFQITLQEGRTAWDVMGQLSSGITGVVHEVQFEAGMNDTGTVTTYGTIDNPLVSYGVYNLTTWEDGAVFVYTRNDDHYAADQYRIKFVRYEVIEDQSLAVAEFKAGRLDIVSAAGDYYDEFKYSPELKLTPASTFYRFAFNIAGSETYDLNPVLVYPEFRQAFYFAIDRDEFALEVRAPAYPTFGLLGPVYLSTEYSSISYRGSDAGTANLEDLFPETYGFNPVEAKRLFDIAYANAVAAETIEDGDTVYVEYKFYDVETNWKVANWVKATVEAIFNDADVNKPKFVLNLVATSGPALDDAWDNGHFEMTFGGWQGLNFNAPSMLGQVYNSANSYMLEVGFNTTDAPIVIDLPNAVVALTAWIAAYDSGTATAAQEAEYDAWVLLLAEFDGDTLTTTYDELFGYAYSELYNVADVNYTGKTDDFDAITAALEAVLLDQMINIPLFTRVSATVYSSRVVFEADEYHVWMGWGGLQYMYLQVEED